jgi:RNA polymerase sigma factor (sigma-70 family)
MHAGRLKKPLERLRRALAPADGGGLSDGRLLAHFVATRDEAAFAALVRRHGPLVLGAVRRLVGHEQDAEDCFQAAFLVLAQRAGSVRGGSLAAWLYGVAYRVALRCRCAAARRRSRERQVGQMPQAEVSAPEPQDWRPLLDEELNALPEKYRAAVVLCDLEGKTRKEAARLLGVPEGTLSSRLAQARSLLAGRLSRRGVALSAGALAAALAGGAAAAVPAQLVVSTAQVAALVAAGRSAAVGSQAARLMNEVQKGMLMAKLKICAALAAVTVLLGAGGFAYKAAGQTARPAKGPEVRLERGADARALSELELLRKEVDILKLQVEVLQEKVRALRPAPAAGKREGGMGMPGLPGMGGMPGMPGGGRMAGPGGPPGMPGMPGAGMPAPGGPAGGGLNRLGPGPGGRMAMRMGGAPDAVSQAEAALKALREARDPEARRRATDALEKAVKQLRGQPAAPPTPRQP